MDIERANVILTKAIMGIQEAEIEGIFEATAGSGAQAYEVPSPGSMGMKPKAQKSKGWSTKKFDFVIKAKHPGEEDIKDTLKVSVKGVWAVHKSTVGARRGWMITHVPSGQLVEFSGFKGTFHKKKKDAQRVVDRWIEVIPELLRANNPGVIRKNLRIMQEIAAGKEKKPQPQKQLAKEPTIVQAATMDLLKRNILKAIKFDKWMMTNHVERLVFRDKRLKGTSATEFMKALYALEKEGRVVGGSMRGDPVWRLA